MSTMRGSGECQRMGSPSLYHGKMPTEYARRSRSGLRSPPTASSPVLGQLGPRKDEPLVEPKDGHQETMIARRHEGSKLAVVRPEGFEPPTQSLKGSRSTLELRAHDQEDRC